MPEYDGKVEFVNALSDSPSGQRLASVFPFQYIPTSFFVGSGGRVTASYTGPLTEAELRQRLDELARGSASQ